MYGIDGVDARDLVENEALDEERTMYDHGVGYDDLPSVAAFWQRYLEWRLHTVLQRQRHSHGYAKRVAAARFWWRWLWYTAWQRS